MTTTTLERAFDSLRALPLDMQEEIGAKLLAYTSLWRELRAGIARGADELAQGEGIEITDVDDLAKRILKPHGRP